MVTTHISKVLKENRDIIAREWSSRLQSGTNKAFSAPPDESSPYTVEQLVDACFELIIDDDVQAIDAIIRELAKAGFRSRRPASDFYKSLEMFRSIVMPLLVTSLKHETAIPAIDRLNASLSYLLQTYSDYRQVLQETDNSVYARRLEYDAAEREAQLFESESKFRDLAEKATVGIYLIQDD
ncbi:MAG: hypothetical protein WDK95_16470, partial [Syntrophorhabdaceae bacterium]